MFLSLSLSLSLVDSNSLLQYSIYYSIVHFYVLLSLISTISYFFSLLTAMTSVSLLSFSISESCSLIFIALISVSCRQILILYFSFSSTAVFTRASLFFMVTLKESVGEEPVCRIQILFPSSTTFNFSGRRGHFPSSYSYSIGSRVPSPMAACIFCCKLQ